MAYRYLQLRRILNAPAGSVNAPRNAAGITTAVSGAAAVLALLGMGAVNADQPISTPKCALRLVVEVTPDVPNPADGGFISSLLGDHTGYQLWLLQVADDTHVVLQLQGPGSAANCRGVVDAMRDDARVASIATS
jgi:hypothetical protein